MKKIIFLFAILCSLQVVKAQKKQNVYLFKNNGKEVDVKDSADYVRIIQEPDSGEVNFILQEFYANGKRKTAGKVSAFEPFLVYDGVIVRFDKEGKRKEITTYEKGGPIGMSYHYFSNGKLNKQLEYLRYTSTGFTSISSIVSPENSYNPNSKLIYFADSLGKAYIEEGNGHFIETINTLFGERTEEGDYKEGVKHGVWKGSQVSANSAYTETYDMGKFISGETTKDGIKYPYSTKETLPTFKGGMTKFYEYVRYSVRYPTDAVRNRMDGTVIVEFTVEKDGNIADVDVKKQVYPSLDNEAKRVVRFSPKWIPASQRGVPVRVKYSIPLKFTMP